MRTAPTPRPYQLAADAAITHEHEVRGVRSTLYVAATGTGKSVVIAERVRRARSHGGRVLVIAHREELLAQLERKLEDVGISADREQGKRRASTTARVVVASVQTLRGARLTRWARDHFGLVIIDEAHHAPAPGYRAICDHFGAAKVLGVTATPLRADGAALGDVFESVAYRYEIRDAIREGYLVPILARQVQIESVDLRGVATRAGDFAVDQLAAVMETERAILGVVVPLLELAGERPTVVFGVDVAHATALADRINAIRPGAARAVSGETDDDERREMLEAFERGEFQFLTNCCLLLEGWDCPPASCIAMARPTKSWSLFVQAIGRGMRPSPATGKRDALILNFTGRSKHRLVGPADCLAGSELGMAALADDIAAEIDRLLGTRQLELDAVIATADAEVGRRRAALAKNAIVQFAAEEVDPFVGPEPSAIGNGPQLDIGWANRPVTEAQRKALEAAGVTVSKLPPSFSMADATRLLIRLKQRRNAGLCSLAQAKRIAAGTGIDPRRITFARAKELCTLLRIGGWRPQALFGTPEYIAAANARQHDLQRLVAPPDGSATSTTSLDHEALP